MRKCQKGEAIASMRISFRLASGVLWTFCTHRLAVLVGAEIALEAAKNLHYVITRLLEAISGLPNVSFGMSLFLEKVHAENNV